MRTEVKKLLQINQGVAPSIKGTLLLTFKLIDGIKEMQRMIFTKNTLCLLMGIMLLHLAPVKALMEVFMGSIYRRGNVYWVKYYQNGKTHRESSKSDKKMVAKKLLLRRENEIEKGKFQ